MPKYLFHISDGVQAEVPVDAQDDHEAVNHGINALHAFVSGHFPPPEDISIAVMTERRSKVATINFTFTIHYEAGLQTVN